MTGRVFLDITPRRSFVLDHFANMSTNVLIPQHTAQILFAASAVLTQNFLTKLAAADCAASADFVERDGDDVLDLSLRPRPPWRPGPLASSRDASHASGLQFGSSAGDAGSRPLAARSADDRLKSTNLVDGQVLTMLQKRRYLPTRKRVVPPAALVRPSRLWQTLSPVPRLEGASAREATDVSTP